MSANEIEKAKELGPKYWLYFVGGINIKDRSASMIPQLFQDPVNTIFESEDYDSNCARVWVKLKADSF